MIRITRLDGKEAVVNDDLVLFVEDTPDTVLTFTTGERVVVREPVDEILERAARWKRRIHTGLEVLPGRER